MSPTLKTIIPKIKDKFFQLFNDNLISLVLFGSQARGDITAESDIDILVVLREKEQRQAKREEIIDFIAEISLEFGVLVSCVYVSQTEFETEKSPLLLNIHREGIPL
ncbi:MAG: hypothetical protein RLZZ490_612 [Cyanobacteriota bacterium]|jgi:predicted nucleotidyltransferase